MVEVYASTGAFRSRDLFAILREAEAAGITGVELSAGLSREVDVLKALDDRAPSIRFLVHNYFPPEPTNLVINLGSANPQKRRASVEFCKRAIAIARRVGSEFYSVHSAFCIDPDASQLGKTQTDLNRADRNETLQNFYESLEELARHAATAGVKLCIENNVCEPVNLIDGRNLIDLMSNPKDFENFVSEPGLMDILFLIDVGHLKVSARTEGFSPSDFFDVVRDRTALLHLSDNDGCKDQNLIYDSEAWFWPHVAQCRNVRAAIIEVYRLETAEIARICRSTQALLCGI